MKVTAIISFTLIGLLFLLQECGNSDTDKEYAHKAFPEYQAPESKDKSYKTRDEEIVLASYSEDDVEEEVPTTVVKHVQETEKKVETALVVESPKEIVKKVENVEVPTEKVTVVEPVKVEVELPEVPEPVKAMQLSSTEVETVKKEEKISTPQSIIAVPVETVDNEKVELQRVVEEKSRAEKVANREISELSAKKNSLEQEITKFLTEQEQNEKEIALLNKNYKTLELNLTNELKRQELLNGKNIELQDEVAKLTEAKEGFSQKYLAEEKRAKELEANLTSEIEKQGLLGQKNSDLQLEVAKLLTTVEEATQAKKIKSEELQALSLKYTNIEANLSSENQELKSKVEELNSTKEALNQKYLAQIEQLKELEILSTKYKSLEANLTAEMEKQNQIKERNIQLKSKVATLLSMGQEMAEKATLVQETKNQELEALSLKNRSLEANLSSEIENQVTLKEKNSQLKSEIEKMLLIAKEGTTKATDEQEARAKEFEVLSLKNKALEANLSSEIENKVALKEKNSQLKSEIEKMLLIAKEGTTKATDEQESKAKEFTLLSENYKSLEQNLSLQQKQNEELESKIAQLVSEKELLDKKYTENQSGTQELEALSSKYKNLEANLSVELEKQEALVKENSTLKAKIEALNLAIKENEALLKEKANLETLLKEQKEQLSTEKAATTAALLQVQESKAEVKKFQEEQAKAKVKEEAKAELSSTFTLTHVEFKHNSMDLTEQSKELLNRAAEAIKTHTDFNYNIQGHTDSMGNKEYNVKLSKERAEEVKKYLVSQGVSEALLRTQGFGPSQPIADNSTKEGRLKNRRVVFEIIEQ